MKNVIKKENKTKKSVKIISDMKIDEIMQIKPKAAEILFKEGVHCFGCMASHFETIEQGLKAHNKTKKQIEDILKKLNK